MKSENVISYKREKPIRLCPDGAVSAAVHPFRTRVVELRNRFVLQPHFTALGTLEGQPTDAHVAYHEERARSRRRP